MHNAKEIEFIWKILQKKSKFYDRKLNNDIFSTKSKPTKDYSSNYTLWKDCFDLINSLDVFFMFIDNL